MTQIQTIRPEIHERLLAELPRFFGDPVSSLRELLQNALRAGASSVAVMTPEQGEHAGRRVVFWDNGRGCTDPQALLSVARSDWEGGVIDPAGMGVLSLFTPELTERVIFSSRDWRFSVTPQEFKDAERVGVEFGHRTDGLVVEWRLLQPLKIEELLREARARCPLIVLFNGREIAPAALLGEAHTLPCGTLTLIPWRRFGRPEHTVYWEGFPIQAEPLPELIAQHLSPAGLAYLDAYDFAFEPSAHSGVRPKLPDRNALLDNAALRKVAARLAEEIERQAHALCVDLDGTQDFVGPDLMRSVHVDHRLWSVRRAYLGQSGYIAGWAVDATGMEIEVQDDPGDDSVAGYESAWVRRDTAVHGSLGQEAARQALGIPGIPCASPNEDLPRLVATVAQPLTPDDRSTHLCERLVVARNISVCGVSVPWYVQGRTLYLAGTPDTAEATLRASQVEIGGAFLADFVESGRYQDELVDGAQIPYSLDAASLGEELLLALIRSYFPARREAREKMHWHAAVAAQARAAVDALAKLGGCERVLTATQTAIIPELRALTQQHEAEAEAIKARHRLD